MTGTADHRAAGAGDEDMSHGMLLALLMSRGGSIDVNPARFAEGMVGGEHGAVELVPLDAGLFRIRAVPPAGMPEDQPAHARLLGILAALGGHADVPAEYFGEDVLGTPDGAFHAVAAAATDHGAIRFYVAPRGPSAPWGAV